jgi:hypothetical protein
MNTWRYLSGTIAISLLGCSMAFAQNDGTAPKGPMTFFITSASPGDGGNLGGLQGADAHCQKLATAVGAGNKTWRAYLSTQAKGNQPAVNARDRIGKGPWFNSRKGGGVIVARDLADLHGDTLEAARIGNNINMATALNEKGERVTGVFDSLNLHDIMTGSRPDGRAFTDGADHTCQNWTSNGNGKAELGHHDRTGGGPGAHTVGNSSWNSSHPSVGCSQASFAPGGGAALFYCFAAD